jgi:hypothetical protein
MKLTLTTDDGRTNTITMEGEPGERLKTMQQMCVLLDQMTGKGLERDKDNGC